MITVAVNSRPRRQAAVLIFGAILWIFPALGNAQQSSKPSPGAGTINLTEQNAGQTIQAWTGSEIVIQLPANPTTGYSWASTANPAPLVFEKSQYLADSRNEGVAGSGGTQLFQFAADVSGSAKITLEYRRSWEKDAPPAKTFSVTINVVSK